MKRFALLFPPVLLLLAACSDPADPAAPGPVEAPPAAIPADRSTAAPTDTAAAPQAAPPDNETTGGDGSPIMLLPLEATQLERAQLSGELSCHFTDAAGETLLLARADVVPDGMVRAAINHGGYLELLANGRAGGFNDLLDGIVLSGKGLTVLLVRGGAQASPDESSTHAATMTVQRADGAERRYPGTWRCGP